MVSPILLFLVITIVASSWMFAGCQIRKYAFRNMSGILSYSHPIGVTVLSMSFSLGLASVYDAIIDVTLRFLVYEGLIRLLKIGLPACSPAVFLCYPWYRRTTIPISHDH
ncbi:hypothetical protein BJY01DRAFT_169391 [Aspergillus pseudoustus]|uniref:Uncharacterized protein n=1 Tax=Aspergillus pseudoustus TaxID=1810923 RepID=A0ABR4K3U0_9EURO